MYKDFFRKDTIHGELALTDFEDVRREEPDQAHVGAGQDSHGHQFLDLAVIPRAQVGNYSPLPGAAIAQGTDLLHAILCGFEAAVPARDGVAVRAGQGMSKQGTDFVFQTRA
jgi:hypothetical protein